MDAEPAARGQRAINGLAWAIRGLVGFLLDTALTAIGLLAFIVIFDLPSPSLFQRAQLEDALTALSWTVLLVGLVSGLGYAVGLAGIYGGRRGHGPDHIRSVEQSVPWLGVTMVLLGSAIIFPSITGPFLTFPGIGYAPPAWALSASVVLAGLRATFAGLTLYYAVQALAEEDERVRLLLAMSLGVVGAVVWSGLAVYAQESGGPSTASLVPFVAGLVAGLGTSAISLGLFAAVYREIRDALR